MVVAWCAGDGKKPYADPHQAYFEIAKQMVTRKYPPWIHSLRYVDYRDIPESAMRRGWSHAIADQRVIKARELFFERDDEGDYVNFDGVRWKKFVRRVAKFIAFVDRRRAELGQHPDTDGSDEKLDQQEQYAESRGVAFLEWGQRTRQVLDVRVNEQYERNLKDEAE
jgi:hypothetical protein